MSDDTFALETDRALLDLYRRGDRSTLSRLYRHYSASVLRALSRGFRVGSGGVESRVGVGPLDLDAAHQEAFVRVFSESARLGYDGLSPFEPYLLAIARRAAVDVLRAQGKLHREAVALDDAPEAPALADDADDPEQVALRTETAAVVRAFLKTLDGEALSFATARFIDGESQLSAAARCGWSRQHARTQEAKLKAECVRFLTERGWLDASAGKAAVAAAVLSLFLHG